MILQEHVDRIVKRYEQMSLEDLQKESEDWLDILTVSEYGEGGDIEGYIITVTAGGPHIVLDTYQSEIRGYWGGEEYKADIDNDVCDKINEILAL